MLGVNEVPEPVMVRYFQYKKYIDKIGSHISVMDLLNMAVECGFNLETGLFQVGEFKGVPILAKTELDTAEVGEEAENTHTLDLDEAAATGGTVVDETAEKRDQLEFEDVIENGPAEPKTTEPIEDGTTVQVYMGEELQDGIVKGHEVAEGGAITYKVEIDGETHELSEDDVDA
jgi:hypothetical protein